MCHRKWDLIGIFAWHGKSCKTLLHSVGRAQFVQGTKLQCQIVAFHSLVWNRKNWRCKITRHPRGCSNCHIAAKFPPCYNPVSIHWLGYPNHAIQARQYKEAQSLSLAWALAWVFGGRAWRCQNSLQIHVHSLARGNDPWCLAGLCEQFVPSNTKIYDTETSTECGGHPSKIWPTVVVPIRPGCWDCDCTWTEWIRRGRVPML